jgi:hypothetical protein
VAEIGFRFEISSQIASFYVGKIAQCLDAVKRPALVLDCDSNQFKFFVSHCFVSLLCVAGMRSRRA